MAELEGKSAECARDGILCSRSRDLVTLAVTGSYLQLIATSARIDSPKAQIVKQT